jgi:hypothetical protein
LRLLISLLIAGLLFSPCLAADMTGTKMGSWMNLGGGARAIGMGGVGIAVSNDPNAIYWNSANIASTTELQIASTYTSWFSGIGYTNLAFTRPWRKAAVGLAIDYVAVGSINETTLAQPGGTGSSFAPTEYCITAAYAQQLNPKTRLGVNAKVLNESISSYSAGGLAADVGLLWQGNENTTFGLCARNLLGSMGSYQLSSNVGLGMAFNRKPFLLGMDVNFPNDSLARINCGLEYTFREQFFGRLGYNTRNEENAGGGLTAGLGFNFKGFRFDYAYVPYGDLGATHRFSLVFIPSIPQKKG